MNKLKIALFTGGASPERPVSKLSSKSIYQTLNESGHEVMPVDPALGLKQHADVGDYFGEDKGEEISHKNYTAAMGLDFLKDVDLAFIGLHGKWGEDGTLQSLLEIQDIRYTGSGVLASALAMDKGMSKTIFRQNGIHVHNGFTIVSGKYDLQQVMSRIEEEIGYPAVVKPNDQGSTFGLTICKRAEDIKKALDFSFSFSDTTIIETFVPGRELTVGILDGTPLPVLEIKPKHELYDYECKYTHGMSEYIVPAEIPRETANQLRDQALLAYNSLGCKNYGRVDFKLRPDGSYVCFEVNTLPGMTSTSLLPKMAKVAGISFTELIERIILNSLNGNGKK